MPEKQRERLQFEERYDILVAGAGVAGVAAALECARAGLKTALIEKTVFTGGLATTGLVNVYLPLCDGRGHQVTFGIAEELLHLSLRYGPGAVPAGWPGGPAGERTERFRTPFNPASFIIALDDVLLNAGVSLWLDTLVCTPAMTRNTISGLEVENKSGRGVLWARCVIDATGDADVAYRAGAPCAEAGNWLSLWVLQLSLEQARRAAEQESGDALLDRVSLGGDNAGNRHPQGFPRLRGTDGRDVTRFILESRRLAREHYGAQQAKLGASGRERLFPVTLPAMAQFRTTRRICGQETLADSQVNTHLPTSVGMAGDWRERGKVWEIPYGALLPQGVHGLLVAGRCLSAETDAWEATRVIASAALTGQVCGVAARLAIARDVSPDNLAAGDIQGELRSLRMPYHISDAIEEVMEEATTR